VRGVGWRKEKRPTRKKPPLVVTKEVTRRVQGEVDNAREALAVTGGGMREQSRKARVKPSTMERGSSMWIEGDGTKGRASTTTWARV